jgi:hypothetical protein
MRRKDKGSSNPTFRNRRKPWVLKKTVPTPAGAALRACLVGNHRTALSSFLEQQQQIFLRTLQTLFRVSNRSEQATHRRPVPMLAKASVWAALASAASLWTPAPADAHGFLITPMSRNSIDRDTPFFMCVASFR